MRNVEDVFCSKPRIKLLKILISLGELNISDIARRLAINYKTTNDHLRVLEDEDMLRHRTYGRIRLYRLNEMSAKVRAFRNLVEAWEQVARY